MYLEKKRIPSDDNAEEIAQATLKELKEESEYIEIAYWRKANQIHEWFNKKIGGIENCEYYKIKEEDLKELLSAVQKVLKYRNEKDANKVLPTSSGFFFGSTEYDTYYWRELEDTEEMLQNILKETDFSKEEIYYYASW